MVVGGISVGVEVAASILAEEAVLVGGTSVGGVEAAGISGAQVVMNSAIPSNKTTRYAERCLIKFSPDVLTNLLIDFFLGWRPTVSGCKAPSKGYPLVGGTTFWRNQFEPRSLLEKATNSTTKSRRSPGSSTRCTLG